jgi:hypothetical protein
MTARASVAPTPPPIRGKQLAALRAVAGTPGGLRVAAYPTTMPLLAKMRLVEERPVPRGRHGEGRAWFLTVEGRQAVKAYGVDDG